MGEQLQPETSARPEQLRLQTLFFYTTVIAFWLGLYRSTGPGFTWLAWSVFLVFSLAEFVVMGREFYGIRRATVVGLLMVPILTCLVPIDDSVFPAHPRESSDHSEHRLIILGQMLIEYERDHGRWPQLVIRDHSGRANQL